VVVGSPEDEFGHPAYAEVQTPIELTRSFEIQQTETTQAQWTAVGFYTSSEFGPNGNGACASPNCPIGNLTGYEVLAFANRMSELHDPPLPTCYTLEKCEGEFGKGMVCESHSLNAPTPYECRGYRLSEAAEWEYAARVGTTTAFYSGPATEYDFAETLACNSDENMMKIGWYCYNSDDHPHPVAQKEPNAWGLYDMSGNVGEWTLTPYDSFGYGGEPLVDPILPPADGDYIVKGGHYGKGAATCRSASTYPNSLDDKMMHGIRLVRTLE